MLKPTKILLYMSWVSEEKGFLEGSCLNITTNFELLQF